MPGKGQPILAVWRGTPAYRRFLADLQARTGIATTAELLDAAINRLAFEHGLVPPMRSRPFGTNQYSEPEPPPRVRPTGRPRKAE